ncbi:peptidase S41 [Rhizobium rhizosphaerae]|uniref:Peptidase S41 n=1 Tax=Xaviernesmea rhizosphaerae TaxID=1672749 RepID=A0A1Q9AN08_9HYPH|nr:S41 family peptidase [Xaviernesmea rhizosphaerae]OLP56725.1 peptidase S41 [Xaviernesmea rhizosphaerae]OQP88324.1 peptidase S41 [Xaviernesmea rhizosphaerae]
MMRRFIPLFAGAAFGASAMWAISTVMEPAQAASVATYRQLATFGAVLEQVERNYVTPQKEGDLVENAINGMLSSLDPHSSYMNAKDAEKAKSRISGEFGGLGLQVTMEDNLVKVVSPMDDTPGAKAGVLAGDLITEIDGQSVKGMKLEDAVGKMRGKVKTPVKLTLVRKGADKPIRLTILRDTITVEAVRSRVEGDVGYIRIISFTEKTQEGLEAAIAKIKKEIPEDRLKGYVLDLRLNPGGLVNQAVSVSDSFLDRGAIVSMRGRNPEETRRYEARPGDLTDHKPIIVLVNGGSASAAEIVSGALQDLKRATVLGTRSFGKGSVQTIIPMNDGGALRLTTALYYTPSGKSIQGTGITPDIIVEQPLPPELQGKMETTGESSLRGHIQGRNETDAGSGSSAYVPPEAKDDLQLQAALKLLRGEKTDPAFPPRTDKAAALK